VRGSEAASSLVAQGEALFDDAQFARALGCAEDALRHAPGFLPAVCLKAAAHDALEDVEAASAAHEHALRLAPRDLGTILGAAEFYLCWGRADAAERWLDRARELAHRGAGLSLDQGDEFFSEFAAIEANALTELGAPRNALQRLDEAVSAWPSDARLRAERGLLLFELCRFDDARKQFEGILDEDPRNADALHGLGLLAERAGNDQEANIRFSAARDIAPDDYPLPVHLSAQEFDRAVEDALSELPAQIREYLRNVAITIEAVPADDDLLASEPPLSPSILGLFRGSPIGDKASMDPWSHFPSSIVLYQNNLERFATDRDELVDEIGVTLLHEVGHFLGLDEDDLRERGLD
jgi:predicted Zn-dependent protease with MMP-like domain/Flp pilus assembly protein TadD